MQSGQLPRDTPKKQIHMDGSENKSSEKETSRLLLFTKEKYMIPPATAGSPLQSVYYCRPLKQSCRWKNVPSDLGWSSGWVMTHMSDTWDTSLTTSWAETEPMSVCYCDPPLCAHLSVEMHKKCLCKEQRWTEISEGKEKLVSKDTEWGHFHVHLVRLVVKAEKNGTLIIIAWEV